MARFLFYDDKLVNLLLQEDKPSGGASVQAYGWVMGLKEEGQDVHILTGDKGNSPLKEECRDLNLVPMYDPKKGVRWLRWIYYRLPYTYKKIKEVKPDYLYLGIPGWTSFFMGVICRMLNIKFIQRLSNDNLLDERFYKNHSALHRFFMYRGLKLADYILCQNNYQLQVIRQQFPGKNSIKISNPLYLQVNGDTASLSVRRYIAWLGIYRYPKNLKLLYEIAARFSAEAFLVAGKESSNSDEETEEYLQRLKQLPNVRFAGFLQREQVLPYLAQAKFLLNTSRYEGFSNTFLEAMSVGTPILSGSNVNPDAIITSHRLGMVYRDVDHLQQQYASLTAEDYRQLSENALTYVEQHHGYRLLSKKLLTQLTQTEKPGTKYGVRNWKKEVGDMV